jgi:3-oxoacyl-[acyl-carrier protein] reductase
MSFIPTSHAHPSLENRVVIVTGGGRGLGQEMALALICAGARVLITGSREAKELTESETLAAELGGADRIAAIQADVTRPEDCARTVAAAIDAFGTIDALVNNAGRGLTYLEPDFIRNPVKFWEADSDAWRMIVDTNVNGPFNMAKAVAPHLIAQGFGRVVNVSTSEQTMVRAAYSPYGPSKAALEASSAIWAKDLAETGVTVNVLLPGGAADTSFIPGHGTERRGSDGMLLEPRIMRAPILWLISDLSNDWTGGRYVARLWDDKLDPGDAADGARQPGHDVPSIM